MRIAHCVQAINLKYVVQHQAKILLYVLKRKNIFNNLNFQGIHDWGGLRFKLIKCTLRKFPLYITFASPHPFLNQFSSICVVYQYTVQENSTGTVVSTTLQKTPLFYPL